MDDSLRSANYVYAPNSSLVDHIDHQRGSVNVMTTSKSYDKVNRLTSIGQQLASVPSYSYGYNALDQRKRATLGDGSYWSYGYDGYGQVTSGAKKWNDNSPVEGQQYGYSFDAIGNRTGTITNGRSATYAPNLLNQYTSRTVPGAFDVLGTANPQAIVTVNEEAVTRRSDYFYKQLTLANTASPVYAPVEISGVRNNQGPNGEDAVTENNGFTYLPQTPESYAYDDDGNLIQDGRWIYTWDGENRLIKMEAIATVPAAAKKKLEFAYDEQSRRIEKKVSTWNAGNSAYQLASTTRFLYDDWNLIAELDFSPSTNHLSPITSFVWGLDLSNSLQGAGGVGGLVLETKNASGTSASYFPAYDGNGNVIALVNAADATVAATYEYGPFGEGLRDSGPQAGGNAFRFSTKYRDDETGLLYYGYRYYQPQTGRWTNRDIIEEEGGLPLYVMVLNDALNQTDLLGQKSNSPGTLESFKGTAIKVRKDGTQIIAGMNFKATVKANCPGQLEYVQLVKETTEFQRGAVSNWITSASTLNQYWLDNTDPYLKGQLKPLPASEGKSTSYRTKDRPFVDFQNTTFNNASAVRRTSEFKMYIAFRDADQTRTTLGVLSWSLSWTVNLRQARFLFFKTGGTSIRLTNIKNPVDVDGRATNEAISPSSTYHNR